MCLGHGASSSLLILFENQNITLCHLVPVDDSMNAPLKASFWGLGVSTASRTLEGGKMQLEYGGNVFFAEWMIGTN